MGACREGDEDPRSDSAELGEQFNIIRDANDEEGTHEEILVVKRG